MGESHVAIIHCKLLTVYACRSASQLRAYRPPPIPDYDGRSVPISEDDNDKQPGDDGEPNEEDEPYYEYAAPYEDAYAGFRDLRGANIRAWS